MPQERTTGASPGTVVTALLAGGAIALGVTLFLMALTAWLIAGGSMGEEWAGRAGMVGAALGCLVGGRYAIGSVRSRALLVGLGTAALFLLLWLGGGAAPSGERRRERTGPADGCRPGRRSGQRAALRISQKTEKMIEMSGIK